MAQAVNGYVRIELNAAVTQDIGLADTAEARAKRTYQYDFLNGTGLGKVGQLWTSEARSLASSANEALDLSGTLKDAFNNTVAFTKVKAILVKAAVTNTNDVVLGGAATNGFISIFGGATHQNTVKPGGLLLLVAPDANGFACAAGTADQLKVANSAGGSAVLYDIAIMGE